MGLHAAEAGRRCKHRGRAAQLVGLGGVLRVVDDDATAVSELQRVLQGPWLRARLSVGNDEDAHMRIEPGARERGLRLLIDALDDEQHVELVLRIVDSPQRAQQVRHDASLAKKRHEHRVGRQLLIAQRRVRYAC